MSKPSERAVYQAVEVLFTARHSLPSDVFRSLDCIVFRASAARFGEPYEDFTRNLGKYAEHDVARCEAES
jgi:hypothetical protein